MTVEQAVIDVIIGYLETANRYVPISAIEQAHPEHQLSGRARLRGLRQKGFLSYSYDEKRKAYRIFTPLAELYEARRTLQRGRELSVGVRGSNPPVIPYAGVKGAARKSQVDEEEPMSAAEVRKMIESLGN